MIVELFLLLASVVATICYWIKYKQSTYWQSLGVKCPPSKFPMGGHPITCNDVLLGKVSIMDVMTEQYRQAKGEKYYGVYQLSKPFLVLKDPELIKQVLVKDFSHFVDRVGEGLQKDMRTGKLKGDRIWGNMLVVTSGNTWKNARSTFTPIFTSGKMKAMLTFMEQVNDRLISSFDAAAKNREEIELKEKFGKFSMDTIALCAFGMDAESFTDPKSVFVKHAKSIFRRNAMDKFKLIFASFIPGGWKLLELLQIPVIKSSETIFFEEAVQTTLRERKKSNIRRNDLIDLMLDAMREESNNEKDSEDEDTKFAHKVDKKELDEITIVSTAMIMLIAGYDTTASTLSYATYELAMNPDVQNRLQEEIDEATEESEGKMPDYSKIQSMEYLDMVFHETLRLHPLAAALRRACVDEYTIPGTNIKINKGEEVFINAAGIHADPEYYPEPEKFVPERFSKEGRAARHPYTFLGFGQGPRNCIGMRFATLEAKTALIALLSKYNVVKSERTIEKVELDPNATLGVNKGGLYVKLIPRY